tara:strand:+ start:16 stop:273 length:258 start_codon:yes stop_codon:yes gene_type:complete
MKLEVKQWPESQEVMDKDEWFFIQSHSEPLKNGNENPIGDSAYARIVVDDRLEKAEKLLVEITLTGSHYQINEKIKKYFKEKENG